MKAIILFVSVMLLVGSIVILFTETERAALGMAIGLACAAGYGFRLTTEEE